MRFLLFEKYVICEVPAGGCVGVSVLIQLSRGFGGASKAEPLCMARKLKAMGCQFPVIGMVSRHSRLGCARV